MNIINDMLVDKCFLDNANARAVVPAYKEKTDSGNPITLTDSVENKSLGMKLYGWSKQETTTGKNLCSIKSCQLSENIVKSDIVPWTKKNRIYFSCDTENVENSNAYISVDYYDKNRKRLGGNGALISCNGTRKEAIFSGNEAGLNSTNIDLTTVEYIIFKVGLLNSSVPTSFIDNIMSCDEANQPYELYTGGKPSPSPEYPQDIVSAGQKLITGKNLINADDYYSEYKQFDGMYKVDDIKLNDITIIFDSGMVGKTYTASCNLNCPNTVSSVVLEATIDGKKMLGNNILTNKSGISKVTFTPKTVRDSIKITYGTGRGDIIFSDFQIEAGSFATSYEPYTGGVPALYQKDIEVRVTGKNLFGGKAFADEIVEIGGSLDETNKTVTISASKLKGKNIYEFPDKTKQYTVMLSGHNLYSVQSANLRIVYEDNLNVDLVFVNGKLLFVTDKNKKPKKIIGIYYTGITVFDYEKFGIFEGVLTETDFKSYEHQSFPIATPTGLPAIPVPSGTSGITYTDSDGQAWIADEIDFSRGKYIQRVWKGVFDGSSDEEWSEHWREGTYTTRIKWSDLVLPRKILCNQYICGNGIGQFDSLLDNGQLHLYFNYDNGTIGMDAFKALIASNPLVVMAYVDTPIETDLTQEEIETYKNLVTYAGTTIVENDSDCWMDVTYKAGTSGKSKNEALRWYFKNVMPLVE